MKITAQEEYGLRILIRLARAGADTGLTIPQLSEAEGLTTPYVAKLTRHLRMQGFINSTPGNKGGYILSRPAANININDVLKSLGGALFDSGFCGDHSGSMKFCTNSVDCSARSLWQMIQLTVDRLLNTVSLQDLVSSDNSADQYLIQKLEAAIGEKPVVNV
jgi:Rrf2 family transcriptional regulator, iron-sulfur cluster assembly transcription factor